MYCTNCGKDQTLCACEPGVRHLAPRPRSVVGATLTVLLVLIAIPAAIVLAAGVLGGIESEGTGGVIWLAVIVGGCVALNRYLTHRGWGKR